MIQRILLEVDRSLMHWLSIFVSFCQRLPAHTLTNQAMFQLASIICLASLATATITISDPSDTINPANWAADNSLLADFNIQPVLYQTEAIVGPYSYSDKDLNITRAFLTVNANDTSVLVIANGSDIDVSYTNIVKFGYCSNLYQASFYGKLTSSVESGWRGTHITSP